MEKKEIHLDQEAEKIFQEIEGIEADVPNETYSEIADLLAECLREEEERLDKWRILLIEFVHALAAYFVDTHFLEGVKKRKNSFVGLINILNKLGRMPGNSRQILIKFRGRMPGGKGSQQLDYVISFDSISVDTEIAASVFTRKGLTMSHLTGRLARAFEIFSEEGINTLLVRIPNESDKERDQLKRCLDVLSRFKKSLKQNLPLKIEIAGTPLTVIPIRDEKRQPDPNLTLVSVVNRMKPETLQGLIKKVDIWIRSSQREQSYEQYAGIYNVFFTIPSIANKLVQPPVEMNNLKWLMVDPGKEGISKAKAVITRHVMDNIPGTPDEKQLALKSVYGRDYDAIDSNQLGDRLEAISQLLESMELTLNDEEVENELLDNVRLRMEDIRDNVFDDISIEKGVVRIRHQDEESIIERIHSKLKDMLFFYKKRSTARQKMKSMMHRSMEFNNEEIEIIAKDFGISEENAQGIVQLLKSCFDKEVRFHRATFEKHIAQFAEYEESVFDILWYYLKEISNRKDRVGFLNALQVLIGKMKKPENALKVLLEDFIRRPDKVAFPDRNIFILSNILVRKYNQEVNLDIELTPEAVLDVYHGLNSEVVKFAAETIDDYQDKFFQKIRTIHKKLLKSIVRTNDDIDEMPLKYLLSLERETFIFFALVQGETSLSILRSALKEYGDPRCEVYQIGQDLKLFSLTLPHLKLIVRAVGRLKDKELVGTLNKIREREMAFLQLGKGVQHEQLVRRVMETADKSIDKILSRPKTPLTEGLTVS